MTYYEPKDCYKELISETPDFQFYWLPMVNGLMVKNIRAQTIQFFNDEDISRLEEIVENYRTRKGE